MTAPIRTMPELVMVADADKVITIVRRHQDITEVFRIMKDRLGLTNEFIDNVGGLTKGHADKILGPSEAKSWGPTTFDLFCEMFAVEFHVRVDLDAAKRMAEVWEGRKRAVEISETKRLSKKLIEKAKPHVAKAMGRAGAAKRMTVLSAEYRSEIARNAINTRWRNERKRKRQKKAAMLSAEH